MKSGLKPYVKNVFGFFAVAGACAAIMTGGFAPPQALAQATACDPQYMDALEARAWMEAQREISQNQNLIVKPDSVLEYSCFNMFLNVVARDASSMFSETRRWGDIPGLGDTSQDAALTSLVFEAFSGYIEENFPHTYLGGRASADASTAGYTNVSSSSYVCDDMAVVWQEAKCLNMFDERAFDGFYDFAWYHRNDPRQLPGSSAGFAACEPLSDAPFNFDRMQQTAFNNRHTTHVLQTENPNDTTAYNVDNLVTFLNFILPAGTDATADWDTGCAPPIMTGISVQRAGTGTAAYPDAVCPNPGCYYTGGTDRRCVPGRSGGGGP